MGEGAQFKLLIMTHMRNKQLHETLLVILTLIMIVSSGLSYAQSVSDAPMNLDFEVSELGSPDTGGWFSLPLGGMKSYKASFSTHTPYSGKQCLEISSTEATVRESGTIWQVINAIPFRGKRINYTAFVRVESEDDARAQLVLRIDRQANPRVAFLDNMHDRPITSNHWIGYTISGFVDNDATKILFGGLFKGKGKVFIDNVTLTPDSTPISRYEYERAKVLSEIGLHNLKIFAKLFGYIRYFHPSDQAEKVKWDNIAINGVRDIESATSDSELVTRLNTIFKPLAPTMQISMNKLLWDTQTDSIPIEATDVMIWKHKGVGLGSPLGMYYSKRERFSLSEVPKDNYISELYEEHRVVQKQLSNNITATIPVMVFAKSNKTLPVTSFSHDYDTLAMGYTPNGNDRATRLADVIILWNVFQHFFPYFDVINTNWETVFVTALTEAASAYNDQEFELVLKRMLAHLNDGHAAVSNYEIWGDLRYAPLGIYVDHDTVVITHVPRELKKIFQVGNIIEKINNEDISKYYGRRRKMISAATPQYKDFMLSLSTLGIYRDDTVKLTTYSKAGIPHSVTIATTSEYPTFTPVHPENLAEVQPGTYYVNLDKMTKNEFEAQYDKLENAKAIIFDLRGYPRGVGFDPIAHLIDKPVSSAHWNIPITRYPDREFVEWDTSSWSIEPNLPRFTNNIVHLIDGRAISAAETYMGIIEYYKIGEIVGTPTAGTNGNVNLLTLPGGYHVSWTGMKVLKHDGSQHHGVGIQPTIYCKPTIQGIREGRDEVLEKGIEVAKMMIEKNR